MSTVVYVVSVDQNSILPENEGMPVYYYSPEGACEAILAGKHGNYGTRYVLKVTSEPLMEYHRSWTLIKKYQEPSP